MSGSRGLSRSRGKRTLTAGRSTIATVLHRATIGGPRSPCKANRLATQAGSQRLCLQWLRETGREQSLHRRGP
jgi:hypothetical protein